MNPRTVRRARRRRREPRGSSSRSRSLLDTGSDTSVDVRGCGMRVKSVERR